MQCLLWNHEIHVLVAGQVKNLQHLIQHLAMLGRDDRHRLDCPFMTLEFLDDGSHFDGFGPGTEQDTDVTHAVSGFVGALRYGKKTPRRAHPRSCLEPAESVSLL